MPRLGVIADDITGGSDIAGVLTREGFRTVQTIGVARDVDLPETDAIVVSLKSRTAPVEDAVQGRDVAGSAANEAQQRPGRHRHQFLPGVEQVGRHPVEKAQPRNRRKLDTPLCPSARVGLGFGGSEAGLVVGQAA